MTSLSIRLSISSLTQIQQVRMLYTFVTMDRIQITLSLSLFPSLTHIHTDKVLLFFTSGFGVSLNVDNINAMKSTAAATDISLSVVRIINGSPLLQNIAVRSYTCTCG